MSDKPVKFYRHEKEHQEAEKLLNESLTSHKAILDNTEGKEGSYDLVLKKEKKRPLLKKLFWPSLSTFIIFAAGYEAYNFVEQLITTNWVLGSFAGALAVTIVVSGGYALFKGWKSRRKFKQRQEQRKILTELLAGNSYGQSPSVLNQVSTEIEQFVDIEQSIARFEHKKQQVHNDQELIQIYSNTVLSGLDKMAIDIVSRHATEAAAMVALSPLAVVDMALVAWRGSKMIEQLSQLYGCPQTALGRFEMTKKVFKNMMLAGASELVADAGVELLGKSLTATISTKAAQGIGVGLLVARMGLQTMHLCRPVTFDEDNRPKLSQIRKSIYQKVVGLVKSASTGKADKNSSAIERNHRGNKNYD